MKLSNSPVLALLWTAMLSFAVAAICRADEPGADPPTLPLEPGDRIVLLGDSLIELEQQTGYWECAILRAAPAGPLVVRNLAWSGDTVWGEARAGFGSQADGYRLLIEQVRSAEPTLIVYAYGRNEAFAGPARLPAFQQQLAALSSDLATAGVRQGVVLTPRAIQAPNLPSVAAYNASLDEYNEAIAKAGAAAVLDLSNLLETLPAIEESAVDSFACTNNGRDLTALGYWVTSQRWEAAIRSGAAPAGAIDAAASKVDRAHGLRIESLSADARGLEFELTLAYLPPPPPPAPEFALVHPATPRLAIAGLPAGQWQLRSEGAVVAFGAAEDWAAGIPLAAGPDVDQAEQLREAIVRKNSLVFNQWRPQNWTYLFGFRKHEQGNNAVEVEQFAPLVAEAEGNLEQLRVPRTHRYTLHLIEASN